MVIAESLSSDDMFSGVKQVLTANEIKYGIVDLDLPSITWFWREVNTFHFIINISKYIVVLIF